MSHRGSRYSSPNPVRGNRGGQRGQGWRGRGRGGSRVGSGTGSPAEPLDDHNQLQNKYFPPTKRGRGGQAPRSGFSSPRGYPFRKNKIPPKPASQPHGGLGFHSLKSIIDLSSLSPFPTSQRPLRGQSDPRFLVPVKFVKATALTDKSLEKPTDEKIQDDSVPIPAQVENQTVPSEASPPGRSLNQELTVEVSNTPPTIQRTSIPIKTAFNPSDQKFQLEMEEITEEAANRWQSELAGLAKGDDEPKNTAIAFEKHDYQLEMEETTSEAAKHWQSRFPGLVASGFASKSCQARDRSSCQALVSESLPPIRDVDGNDPIRQSAHNEKVEIPVSQSIAEVKLTASDASVINTNSTILIGASTAAQLTPDAQLEGSSIERTFHKSSEVLPSPASRFAPNLSAVVFPKDSSAEQCSEILHSGAGSLISDSPAVVSLNDHVIAKGLEISTSPAARPTADSQVVDCLADKTQENPPISPSVAAHSATGPRVGASSIGHGSDENLEISPSDPAPNSQVMNSMVGHPTDKSSPMQPIKPDAQPMLLHQDTTIDSSGVSATPPAINDGNTLSPGLTSPNTAEPQPAFPAAPEAAPSPVFFIDSEGDRNILSSCSFSSQDVNPRPPDEDTDEEEDDQIVFKPIVVAPPCNPPAETSHLSRTISDPVDWMPTSFANVTLQSCSATKSPRPTVTAPKDSKKAIKAAARRRKALRKRNTRQAAKRSVGDFTGLDYRYLMSAQDISDQSDVDWGDTDVQQDNSTAQLSKGATLTRRARKRISKQKEEMEILADYMMHTAMSEHESAEDDENADQALGAKNLNDKLVANDDFLQTFLAGMQAQGHQTTIDELEEEAQQQIDDEHLDQGGWNTDRSSSLNEQIEALDIDLSEEDSDEDDEEPEHMSRKGESRQAIEEGGIFVSSSDLDQVSDDDDMMDNDDGWGNEPDRTASRKSNQTTADCRTASKVATLLTGRSKRLAKTKTRALSEALDRRSRCNGDSDFETHPSLTERLTPESDSETESPDNDSDASPDVPVLTKSVLANKKKQKGKQRKSGRFPASDEELIDFIEDIQAQWAADRARKAERKRARAEARLLNSPKTKKQRQKASRRDGFDESTEPDLSRLNDRIKEFIRSPDRSSYALPPLGKKTRLRIHLLANVYGLKSHSLGGGPTRHPVLERTHRTTLANVNKNKVNDILFGQRFGRHLRQYDDDDLRINHKSRGTPRRGDQQLPGASQRQKTREGMLVGDGVEHLGEDNIGFKLLAKMGWSMGQSIGSPNNQSALQQPLMAVMKNTKGGLGLASR